VDTEYFGVGVTFADGNDTILTSGSAFPTDGSGLNGNGSIELLFTEPQTHIGTDFPGALRFALYNGPTLLYTSSQFGSSGAGHFGGIVVQDGSFDRAILSDPVDAFVFLDNLHYAVIPEPGTLLLAGLGSVMILARRGRRKASR